MVGSEGAGLDAAGSQAGGQAFFGPSKRVSDGRLKVLVVLPSYDIGGAENFCLRLIRHADDSLVDWHVTSGNRKNAQMVSMFHAAGTATYHLSPGYLNLIKVFQFRRFLARSRFDAVMTLNGVFGGPSLLLAKRAGVPVRIGWHRRSTPAFFATPGRRVFSSMSLRWLEGFSTRILSNSEAALDNFHGPKWRGSDMFCVIRNGVDASRFRPDPVDREIVRRELGIPLSSTLIGHVGRFDPAKDHETLLATVRDVRDRGLDARLLVAGTGTDSASFSARLRHYKLEDVTSCVGPRQDVERLYRAMDAFCSLP